MNALPFAALLTTAVLAVACSTVAAPVASPMASTVAVAHVLGSRQCEGGGTKPQALAERLREAGVPVSALTCGHDGRMRPSVCGAADGQMAVLDIDASQLDQARQLGFAPLADWPDARRQPCRLANQ